MKTLGLVLIIIGITATVFTGFTLITQKKVFNVGKLEVDRQDKTPIYWSPIAGVLMIAAGAVFYLAGKKSR